MWQSSKTVSRVKIVIKGKVFINHEPIQIEGLLQGQLILNRMIEAEE